MLLYLLVKNYQFLALLKKQSEYDK